MDDFSTRGTVPDLSLDYDKYEDYYLAIRDNNLDCVQLLLSKASPAKKQAMLNGSFEFGIETLIPTTILSRISRPLWIAAVTGSVDVLELLISEGSDIHQVNFMKGNIIHCLVGSACSPHVNIPEQRSVSVYKRLVRILSSEQIKKLLMHENLDGMRPLEFAANEGCLALYECIQFTPGVYVTKSIQKGLFNEEWIDITEYESFEAGNRRAKSPVLILSFLDTKKIVNKDCLRVLESNFIEMWIDNKFKVATPFMVTWAFLRVLYIVLFFVYVTKGHSSVQIDVIYNGTESGCQEQFMYFSNNPFFSNILPFILIAHSLRSVLEFITNYIHYRKDKLYLYFRSLKGPKNLVMNHHFYLITNMFANLMYLLGITLEMFSYSETRTVVNILATFTCVSSVWSVLFFVQLLPAIGYFAVVMQRMIWVLLKFNIVFAICFLPFPHVLYRLLQGQDGCPNQEFSYSVGITYYNTFTILINMVNFTKYKDVVPSGDYSVLLLLHVIYVFSMAISFLNFLIALLSTSVAEVMEHKRTIMTIQRMCVLAHTERNMRKFPCFKNLWRYLQKKHFHIKDGRIYVVKIGQTFSND